MPRFVQYDTTLVLLAPRNAPQCTAVPSVPLVSQGSLLWCMTPGWWIFPEAHANRKWASAVCIEINSPSLPGTGFMYILDGGNRGYQVAYDIVLSASVSSTTVKSPD